MLHHDHLVKRNNIIGYACQRCNMQMKEKTRIGIPVIFHNASGYDWKFLIKEFATIIEEQQEKLERKAKEEKRELDPSEKVITEVKVLRIT